MTIGEFWEKNKNKYANMELHFSKDNICDNYDDIDDSILEQDMDNVSIYELNCVQYVQWLHFEEFENLDWVKKYFTPDEETAEKILKIGAETYGYAPNDTFCILQFNDRLAISYECTDLIKELKSDINEFGGDTIIAAWCKELDEVVVYTNYDFIEEESPIKEDELQEGEDIKLMTMNDLLKKLERQNDIL